MNLNREGFASTVFGAFLPSAVDGIEEYHSAEGSIGIAYLLLVMRWGRRARGNSEVEQAYYDWCAGTVDDPAMRAHLTSAFVRGLEWKR